MVRFLNIHIDKLLFWYGFILGIFFWWLISKISTNRLLFKNAARNIVQLFRQKFQSNFEKLYREALLGHSQRNHIASSLFPLDDIALKPKIIAPPITIESKGLALVEDITNQTIPYTLDWPHLASVYGAPKLTLEEALSGGSNLILLGEMGSGKSTALFQLASDLTLNRASTDHLVGFLPIYVHAACIIHSIRKNGDLLDAIIEAVGNYLPSKLYPRLGKFVKSYFEEGKALLLLDGLDEMPETIVIELTNYLDRLIYYYSELRVIVAASNRYLGGLTRHGFLPVEIALWDKQDQNNFLSKWNAAWLQINPAGQVLQNDVDKTLIHDWLLIQKLPLTPMELTLKTWSAYSGNAIGPSMTNAIEAYIKYITASSPESQKALEKLALQIIFLESPVLNLKEVDDWELPLSEISISVTDEKQPDLITQGHDRYEFLTKIKMSKFLPMLIENNFLWSPTDQNISFVHQIFAAYLAGKALSALNTPNRMVEPSIIYGTGFWDMKTRTLGFYATQHSDIDTIQQIIDRNKEPLNLELLTAASFLKGVDINFQWRSPVLHKLFMILHSNKYPLSLQVKALTGLVLSDDPGVKVILTQMVRSKQATLRLLGALGYGLVGEADPINDLIRLLDDPIPIVARGACLALVSIGNKPSIDAVTSALLHGQENLQRSAAEALANLPEEGFKILNEAFHMEDLHVRRAVIKGLQRLRTDQSLQILNKIQIEESQWMVKDAATEALGLLQNTNPYIPQPFPAPHNSTWLIKFAGDKGQGISPEKDATDMILLAAKEGSEEQKISALESLQYKADSSILPHIYEIYNTSVGDLKTAAFNALWHLAMAGCS
jgi:HEAT repeat protein